MAPRIVAAVVGAWAFGIIVAIPLREFLNVDARIATPATVAALAVGGIFGFTRRPRRSDDEKAAQE